MQLFHKSLLVVAVLFLIVSASAADDQVIQMAVNEALANVPVLPALEPALKPAPVIELPRKEKNDFLKRFQLAFDQPLGSGFRGSAAGLWSGDNTGMPWEDAMVQGMYQPMRRERNVDFTFGLFFPTSDAYFRFFNFHGEQLPIKSGDTFTLFAKQGVSGTTRSGRPFGANLVFRATPRLSVGMGYSQTPKSTTTFGGMADYSQVVDASPFVEDGMHGVDAIFRRFQQRQTYSDTMGIRMFTPNVRWDLFRSSHFEVSPFASVSAAFVSRDLSIVNELDRHAIFLAEDYAQVQSESVRLIPVERTTSTLKTTRVRWSLRSGIATTFYPLPASKVGIGAEVSYGTGSTLKNDASSATFGQYTPTLEQNKFQFAARIVFRP